VTSNALTFSAHQKLSIGINAAAGSITVGGATTGNGTVTGTPWTRTTGPTMYVGSRQGGTQPLYARIGPVTPSQSSAKIVLFMLGESNMQGNSITAKILGRVQDYYPNAKKVECCIGGTTLYSDWAKVGGAAYASALAAWGAAIAEDPDLLNCTPIIIWGQGETDSYSAGWTAAYGTNLPALFVNIETDRPFFAGCKKIIHMLYPQCGMDPTAPDYTLCASIRSAETAYQAANPTLVATTETSDLVFCDPPYLSNFVGYHGDGFSDGETQSLFAECERLAAKGCDVWMSNADTDRIRELAAIYSAATLISVDARRSIAANGGKRGVAKELLIKF
jgi:hypothetical protein